MKYQTKTALIADCEKEWNRLWALVDSATNSSKTTEKQRAADALKNARSIKDILAHLHAWHRLLLDWYRVGLNGHPDLPAKGFNWRQTPELNRQLHDEFKDERLESISRKLKLSYARVMKLVRSMSERQLMKPSQFEWTGKLALASYVSANTSSHYRWAQKKIKKMGLNG